jgi:hypothetical protein
MLVLQLFGWFIFSCVLMSFIEHQVHCRLMHHRHFMSKLITPLNKTFENHAIKHHSIYSKNFSDEAIPPGTDKHIRLRVKEGLIEGLPVALLLSLISIEGAIIFEMVVCLHHFCWNQIHLEMHKPEQMGFSRWPVYKFLARYHWLHHRYPDKNFNVVFPLADYVLGTSARANAVDLKCMQE